MTGTKAEFRIASRDLTAAALLGPGPALDAAVTQLSWFDGENGHSRISSSDLHHLAQEVMKAAPPSMRLELLQILARQASPTARSVCAFGLSTFWGQEGQLGLVEKLSRDRSSQVQSHLTQALMELETKHQQRLSQEWFHSPVSCQRALAGRLSVAYPASQALEMLTVLASDDEAQVREAVVEALIDLAEQRPEDVRLTLGQWAANQDKHKLWVMARVLSRSPLNRDIPFVIQSLEDIAEQIPTDRDIRRWAISVLRALARQHGNLPIQESLDHWLSGDEATLAEIAAEALRRIA